MAHTCHATDCTTRVAPEMFMCKRHWFMLPSQLRNRIWATYREGQENDKQPSHEYCEAAKDCLRFIAGREGITPDLKLYEVYDPEV